MIDPRIRLDRIRTLVEGSAEAGNSITADAMADAILKLLDENLCPACGEPGKYWEDRQPVHDSFIGYEIREAGMLHDNGRLCTEW